MDTKSLNHFKEMLLREKESMTNTLKLMEENGSGEQNRFASGELSSYDNHPADLGSEVFQITMNNTLKVNEEYNIGQIENALERIENGSYGVCEVCGKNIGNDRLEVLPFARRCIECENAAHNENEDLYARPIEEKVWDAPFGRKHLNSQEDDEYEGSDILYDLAKHGNADSPQDLGGYKDYEEFYTNEVDKQGMTNDIENISNEDYKKQLPD